MKHKIAYKPIFCIYHPSGESPSDAKKGRKDRKPRAHSEGGSDSGSDDNDDDNQGGSDGEGSDGGAVLDAVEHQRKLRG